MMNTNTRVIAAETRSVHMLRTRTRRHVLAEKLFRRIVRGEDTAYVVEALVSGVLDSRRVWMPVRFTDDARYAVEYMEEIVD